MQPERGNVVIQAGACVVTLMPELGGKIASIRVGHHEMLQTPLASYTPRSKEMAFSESDASGWDECLPSVSACRVETPAGTAKVPDHGDLWRVPWQVLESSQDSITMRGNCFSVPLQLTRTLFIAETSAGWSLDLLYSLTNLGSYAAPWSWSAHPLFAVEPGDRISLPDQVTKLRLEGSFRQRLGESGSVVDWPIAKLSDGSDADLGEVLGADAETGDKLFAGPFDSGPDRTWCALERKNAGLRLMMHFDAANAPYLGLWICYGGWPEVPGPKQYCVAIEPCTAPVDSVAVVGAWNRSLESKETRNWTMRLAIERIEEVK